MASRTSPPGTDSSPVVDIEDFVVESSVGWRNGSGQASPPVQYRQRDVRGISGGEGVDGPGGGGRSSFEVSVPQQRGDEQNEGGHDSLAQNDLVGEPNVCWWCATTVGGLCMRELDPRDWAGRISPPAGDHPAKCARSGARGT